MSIYARHIFICANQKLAGKKCCANEGGQVYIDYLKDKLLEFGWWGPGKIRVSKAGCLGRCSAGPCLVIYPEAVWYRYQSFADIDEIITYHLGHEQYVEHLLIDKT
ncbi:MAG: 2Fe-2S ferredoxin [Legionellaceae bacterium]|nr:2Fe-2S ferredoxin [Legionellaceae bacterium]HAF87093.1 2Fe-2S ferredoxin [Legionellales bacterium]HCA89572.1 2Fe-2S ferredoxin [Legionellales bacterium]